MNQSNFNHAGIALLIQAGVYLLFGNLVTGAIAASTFFLSREHTQREYKLMVYGHKYNLKWWQGFTGWSADNWFDFITPTVAVWVVVILAAWLG